MAECSSGDLSITVSEKQVYYSCQDFFFFLSLSEESLNLSSLESSEAERAHCRGDSVRLRMIKAQPLSSIRRGFFYCTACESDG